MSKKIFGDYIRSVKVAVEGMTNELLVIGLFKAANHAIAIGQTDSSTVRQWMSGGNTSYTKFFTNKDFNDSEFINYLEEHIGISWVDVKKELRKHRDSMPHIDYETADSNTFFRSLTNQFRAILGKSVNLSENSYHNYDDSFYKGIVFLDKTIDQRNHDFLDLLTGQTRQTDAIYMYLGKESTERYLEIMMSAEYTLFRDTRAMLDKHMKDIISYITSTSDKSLRIISLGIGNGEKDYSLVQHILNATTQNLEYLAVDISLDMLQIGIRNVYRPLTEDNRNRLNIQIAEADFMDIDRFFVDRLLPTPKSAKRNIFMLLGNTLGNFQEDQLLNKIADVMNSGDILLVDNQLKREGRLTPEEEHDYMNMYNSKKEHEMVYAILKRGGLSKDDGRIEQDVSYNHHLTNAHLKDNNCLTVLQQFNLNNSAISKEIHGRRVKYPKNSIITVYYSRKYTKKAFENIIKDVLEIKVDFSNDKYGMFICQKA
ncbi:MAG: L-histidine N(alpha)-methyltransferase [Defluviitaleaceae bacterium]|nr:L-histidine N(alpha)-methyltransferase [Defluviitaleaceae bacterium]